MDLLSDETILARSTEWSEAMAKFCAEEKFEEISFSEIKTDEELSDDESPDRTNNNNTDENDNDKEKNTCKALVKVENFEGVSSSDDYDEFANQTIALNKEQQNKWKQSGMIDVLETFDIDKISQVVAPWVEKNKLDKTQLSTSLDEHIVHIEEHHHRQIHLDSENDSLHSLDTADYIRSSRKKKRAAHCTTTTIKKFSYVKGSRKQLAKKFGFGSFENLFSEKMATIVPKRALKSIRESENCSSSNVTPTTQSIPQIYEHRSLPERRRKSRQLKRRSDISKRSVSSSSSGSSSPVRHLKPKFQRSFKNDPLESKKTTSPIKRRLKPKKQKTPPQIDLTYLDSTDSECPVKSKRQQDPPQTVNSGAMAQNVSSSNETGFLGASIINSTALTIPNPPTSLQYPAKKCLITPIKGRSHEIEADKTDSDNVTIIPKSPPPANPQPIPAVKPVKVKVQRIKNIIPMKSPESKAPKDITPSPPKETAIIPEPTESEPKKILLYCPVSLAANKEHVNVDTFYLTQDHFVETVGRKNSRRFIKLHLRKFPFEFSSNSRIYFKAPDESDDSASSDEDILYMFGREGKLVEEPTNGEA